MNRHRPSPRAFAASLLAAALAACSSESASPPEAPAPADAPASAPVDVAATEVALGALTDVPLACARSAVAETVAKELGAEGVDARALRNRVSWGVPTMFDVPWISDDGDAVASVRVRPLEAPGAAACVRDALAKGPLEALGTLASLRTHGAGTDTLARFAYARPAFAGDRAHPWVGAARALLARPNDVAGAPKSEPWTEALAESIAAAEAAAPEAVREPLARLILTIAAASEQRALALAKAGGPAALADLHRALVGDGATYRITTFTQAMMAPADALSVMKERAPLVDGRAIAAMGLSVSDAALALGRALAEAPAFEAPRVEIRTAHGRVLLHLDARDDVYGDLSDVALLVDLGGDDRYAGRVAAVVHPWSSASVLVDARGDDRYGPDMPDLRGDEAGDAFSVVHAMTQGFAVLGAAALVDVQPDLRRRRPPPDGQRLCDWKAKTAPELTREFRRLVEATRGVAIGVQGDRHDHVDRLLQSEPCQLPRQQRAEHAGRRELAPVLEGMHQVIERPRVGERRASAAQRLRTDEHGLGRDLETRLTPGAEIEARRLPARPAQYAVRGQQEPTELVEVPVNPVPHVWLTAGTQPLNTLPAVPRSITRRFVCRSRHLARKPPDSPCQPPT